MIKTIKELLIEWWARQYRSRVEQKQDVRSLQGEKDVSQRQVHPNY